MLFDIIIIVGLVVILIDVERLLSNVRNNTEGLGKQNVILAEALEELNNKVRAFKTNAVERYNWHPVVRPGYFWTLMQRCRDVSLSRSFILVYLLL